MQRYFYNSLASYLSLYVRGVVKSARKCFRVRATNGSPRRSWWMRARISGFILNSCRVASGQTVSSIRSNLALIISSDCVVPLKAVKCMPPSGGGWRT